MEHIIQNLTNQTWDQTTINYHINLAIQYGLNDHKGEGVTFNIINPIVISSKIEGLEEEEGVYFITITYTINNGGPGSKYRKWGVNLVSSFGEPNEHQFFRAIIIFLSNLNKKPSKTQPYLYNLSFDWETPNLFTRKKGLHLTKIHKKTAARQNIFITETYNQEVIKDFLISQGFNIKFPKPIN